MGFNDINLQVSGPQQPASIYKTKVLKGNLSFALQVTEPNTKYVIKHNFELDGDVTIPANCVLEFDGGSISGEHTIDFNYCMLSGKPIINCIPHGYVSNEKIRFSWFSNNANIDSDNLDIILNWMHNPENDYGIGIPLVIDKPLVISRPIRVGKNVCLEGVDISYFHTITLANNFSGNNVFDLNGENYLGGWNFKCTLKNLFVNLSNSTISIQNVINIKFAYNITIENVRLKGNAYTTNAIFANTANDVIINRCFISEFSKSVGCGVYVSGITSCTLNDCDIENNKLGIHCIESAVVNVNNLYSEIQKVFAIETISNGSVTFNGGMIRLSNSGSIAGEINGENVVINNTHIDNIGTFVNIGANAKNVVLCTNRGTNGITGYIEKAIIINKENYINSKSIYGIASDKEKIKLGYIYIRNNYRAFDFKIAATMGYDTYYHEVNYSLNGRFNTAIKVFNEKYITKGNYTTNYNRRFNIEIDWTTVGTNRKANVYLITNFIDQRGQTAEYTADIKFVSSNEDTYFVEDSGSEMLETAPEIKICYTTGITSDRPKGGLINVGFQYYDATLGKPIYASAISGDTVTWKDATGATV